MNSRLLELLNQGVAPRFIHFASVYNGGKDSAPPPPDYRGAAVEQSAASKEIANMQNFANRPTQNTPWANTNWTTAATTDPATGQAVTQWTQNQTLNPQLQKTLDEQLGMQSNRAQLAGTFSGRVADAYAQPFSYGGMTPLAGAPQAGNLNTGQLQTGVSQYNLDTSAPNQTTQTTNEPAFAGERQRIEQAMFDRMRPEQQFQTDKTRTMLANQGITAGSDAYNRELQRLERGQADERYNAMNLGGQEQARMQQMLLGQQQQAFGQDVAGQQAYNQALQGQFGQGLQAGQFYNQAGAQGFQQAGAIDQQRYGQQLQSANYQNQLRQQQIAEEAQRRGMSLNEMNALMTGQQVGQQQMPNFMSAAAGPAPNLLGAAQAQGDYAMQQAKMQQDAQSSLWGGIGQLAGTGAMMFGMSDVRLKSNIVKVGDHPIGVGIYEYDIFGRRERGVMAQELIEIAPHLVSIHESGFYMVNYAGLN